MTDPQPPLPPLPPVPPGDNANNPNPPFEEPSEADKIRAGYVDVYTGEPKGQLSRESERTIVMVTHLVGILKYFTGGISIVGPIAVWIIYQGSSDYVKKEAEKAFVQQLVVIVLTWVFVCLGAFLLVIIIGLLFFLLAFIVAVIDIVYSIKYALDANKRYETTPK